VDLGAWRPVGNSVNMHFSKGVSSKVPESLGLDKGIYGSPYVMCKPEDTDGIALTGFIANLDLAFVLDVTWPLKHRWIERAGTPSRKENVTDHDANMRVNGIRVKYEATRAIARSSPGRDPQFLNSTVVQ
jgi:hypothetical protein